MLVFNTSSVPPKVTEPITLAWSFVNGFLLISNWLMLPALAVIAVASFLVAPLGARAAHALPVGKLKRVFASILYVLAAYMLWKGLSS